MCVCVLICTSPHKQLENCQEPASVCILIMFWYLLLFPLREKAEGEEADWSQHCLNVYSSILLFFCCYMFFSLAPRLVLRSGNETFSQGTFIIHSTSSGRTCVTAIASHTTAALPQKSAFNNSCSDSVSFPFFARSSKGNASPSHFDVQLRSRSVTPGTRKSRFK